MNFLGLFTSLKVILFLNNLSCSDSDNESLEKKIIVETLNWLNPNVDNDSSDLELDDVLHDLLKNENFNYFIDLMNKLVKGNHNELKENEKAQNDEILKEIKAIENKTSIFFKINCRDSFQTYLKEILDTNEVFLSLFEKKISYKNVIENLKIVKGKGLEIEYLSFLLSILIKSLDTYRNRNLPGLHLIHAALIIMDKRTKDLKGLIKNYWKLKKDNSKLYISNFNFIKLQENLVSMKEFTSKEQNWDFETINGSAIIKYSNRILFAGFYECVEKENKLYCSIFEEVDRLISDFAAFNELKNSLIRNFDLD